MRIQAPIVVLPLLLLACGKAVDSDREAEAAALGLEGAIERALGLGFDGFVAASSANIPTQTGSGDLSGTMTVDGQVDQGNSDNKGMRLDVALDDYADVETVETEEGDVYAITYATEAGALPHFDLSLRDIPSGTLTGTVVGTFLMEGDLEGEVTLDLSLTGHLVPDGDDPAREEGTTEVTGTATNAGRGTYQVDVTL